MFGEQRPPTAEGLFEAIGQSVVFFDAGGRFRSIIGPLYRSLGYGDNAEIRLPLDVLHLDDRALAAESVVGLMSTGSAPPITVRGVHRDGSSRPFTLTFCSALTDPAIHGFLVVAKEEVLRSASPAEESTDPVAANRILVGRRTLRDLIDHASGSPIHAVEILETISVLIGCQTLKIGVVDRTGQTMAIAAQSGAKDEGGVRSVPCRDGSPLSGLIIAGRPVFIADRNGLRNFSKRDRSVFRSLIGDSSTAFLLPCVWGHTSGLVVLCGVESEIVADALRHEIAAATRKVVEGWIREVQVLGQQQRRYSTILENMADLVSIVDADFNFSFVSPSVARLAGQAGEEMVGKRASAWGDGNADLEAAMRSLAPGEQRNILIRTGAAFAEDLTIDVTVKNMIDDPLVGGWLVNGRDVTALRERAVHEHETSKWRADIAALLTTIANTPSGELATTLETHLNSFIKLVHADRCLVLGVDAKMDLVSVVAEAVGRGISNLRNEVPSYHLCDVAALTDGVRMVDQGHERHQELEDFVRIEGGPDIGASSFFPLRSGGACVGLMMLIRLRKEAFDDESNLQAMTLADTVAAALSRRSAIESLEVQALSDSLTGLGNRRALTKALARAVSDCSRPGGVGIVYCDVDSFKLINDSLGHDAGDEFLTETANRMRTSSRSSDVLIRLGGDEFVVLLDGVGSEQDALQYARHLRRGLMAPITIQGHPIQASLCFGVSFARRDDVAADPSSLMSKADLALLEAKRTGEGEIAVYDAELSVKVRKDVTLLAELDQGINRDELRVYYQPIVDLANTGRVVSVEGLVRWQHPTRGLIFPDTFIPIAEHNKMITRITSVVMEKGLHDLALARGAGQISPDTSFAVNVSVRDLRSKNLLAQVERALASSGLRSSLLHVELTESSAIDDHQVFETLLGLRSIGVQIAIDDFGTGYASLSYLRDIPASMVKIDRSFIQQMDNRRDRSLIAAAIAMSHELDMSVVAEGIETAEQAASLLEMGCDFGQGYLFARPTPDLASMKQRAARA